jgi:hypothetical protein
MRISTSLIVIGLVGVAFYQVMRNKPLPVSEQDRAAIEDMYEEVASVIAIDVRHDLPRGALLAFGVIDGDGAAALGRLLREEITRNGEVILLATPDVSGGGPVDDVFLLSGEITELRYVKGRSEWRMSVFVELTDLAAGRTLFSRTFGATRFSAPVIEGLAEGPRPWENLYRDALDRWYDMANWASWSLKNFMIVGAFHIVAFFIVVKILYPNRGRENRSVVMLILVPFVASLLRMWTLCSF